MKNKLRKQYKNIIIINKEYKDNLIIQNLKTNKTNVDSEQKRSSVTKTVGSPFN